MGGGGGGAEAVFAHGWRSVIFLGRGKGLGGGEGGEEKRKRFGPEQEHDGVGYRYRYQYQYYVEGLFVLVLLRILYCTVTVQLSGRVSIVDALRVVGHVYAIISHHVDEH